METKIFEESLHYQNVQVLLRHTNTFKSHFLSCVLGNTFSFIHLLTQGGSLVENCNLCPPHLPLTTALTNVVLKQLNPTQFLRSECIIFWWSYRVRFWRKNTWLSVWYVSRSTMTFWPESFDQSEKRESNSELFASICSSPEYLSYPRTTECASHIRGCFTCKNKWIGNKTE